jgi:hypothetical protein
VSLRRLPGALAALGLVGVTGAALAAPLCRPPANLIANPGFEAGTWSPGGRPTGWAFESPLTTSLGTWDNTVAHSGRHSVRIDAPTPDDAHWHQPVTAPVGVPLYLSGWLRTDNVRRGADQPSSPGATISALGRWDQTAPTYGTTPWHHVGMSFISDTPTVVPSPRLGFWGGLASGTAWYDDLSLVPRVADVPHPRWKILVLVYPQTDVLLPDTNGVQRRLQGASAPAELAQATEQARLFVERDIPALTSGQMLPTLTVRQSTQPLRSLTPLWVGSQAAGWWPSQNDTLASDARDFDSVIVIWELRLRDVTTGAAVSLNIGPVTPELGLAPTYASVPIEQAGLNGQRNVFKQEWSHGALVYYQALQVLPQPMVIFNPGASQYVNCKTGQFYVWQSETEGQPIPNSIFNNGAGFTHDYLSGTVARAEAPSVCLGIGPQAWAWGGPVTHSGSQPVFTAQARLRALEGQVDALRTALMLGPRPAATLKAQLLAARWALATRSGAAPEVLRGFGAHVQALVRQGLLLPQAGGLLIEAATAAAECAG